MKKILIYAIIAIAVIAAIIVWVRKPKVAEQPPVSGAAPAGVSVETGIDQELQGIDFGGLEEEFQAIDKDLNSL